MGLLDVLLPSHVAFETDFNQTVKGAEAVFTGAVKPKLRELHQQFSGNRVYDEALKYLEAIDFKTASAKDVDNLTNLVASTAADEGIKIGSKFLGEAAVGWAVAAGYTGAGVYTGGIITALGTALSWGASMLLGSLWTTEDEHYEPGDLVVITDDTIMNTKDALRRRRRLQGGEPQEEAEKLVASGIVTGESDGGYVPVMKFKGHKVGLLATNQVAKLPEAVESKALTESGSLRNLVGTLRGLNTKQKRRGRPPHSTKAGDVVEYKGVPAEIVSSDSSSVVLKAKSGTVARVDIGDKHIVDGMHGSDQYVGKIGASINKGSFAWLEYEWRDGMPRAFRDKGYQLVAVHSINREKAVIFRAWDGRQLTVRSEELIAYEGMPQGPYSRFLAAAAEGNEVLTKRWAPGHQNKYFCVTGQPQINQSTIRDRSLSPRGRRKESMFYPVDKIGREREFYDYELAPTDIAAQYEPEEEPGSGNTVLVVGAAFVVLGLVYLNR